MRHSWGERSLQQIVQHVAWIREVAGRNRRLLERRISRASNIYNPHWLDVPRAEEGFWRLLISERSWCDPDARGAGTDVGADSHSRAELHA